MTEVKSQDSDKSKKRPVKLPPQQSATDTSNWEKRDVSAPRISKLTQKRTMRELEFIRSDDGNAKDMILDPKLLETKDCAKKNSK